MGCVCEWLSLFLFVSAFFHARSLYMVVFSVHGDRAIVKLYAYIAVQVWSFPPGRLSKPLGLKSRGGDLFMTGRGLPTVRVVLIIEFCVLGGVLFFWWRIGRFRFVNF